MMKLCNVSCPTQIPKTPRFSCFGLEYMQKHIKLQLESQVLILVGFPNQGQYCARFFRSKICRYCTSYYAAHIGRGLESSVAFPHIFHTLFCAPRILRTMLGFVGEELFEDFFHFLVPFALYLQLFGTRTCHFAWFLLKPSILHCFC